MAVRGNYTTDFGRPVPLPEFVGFLNGEFELYFSPKGVILLGRGEFGLLCRQDLATHVKKMHTNWSKTVGGVREQTQKCLKSSSMIISNCCWR